MTEITQKQIEEYKKIYKKEYGKELTDEEARETGQNLVRFAELIIEQMKIDHYRKKRMEKEPNGFHLEVESSYSCCICYEHFPGNEMWYDQYGIKCINCQRALDTEVIPKYVCTDPNSWFADWKVQRKLGIHSATMRKMIRENKLKPRVIKRKDGSKHFELFIIKENEILGDNTSPNNSK